MKKSQQIVLVLVSATLAQCNKPTPDHERKVYLRSDTTAPYNARHYHGAGLWYYAFRPYGFFHNGFYTRAGYYSAGISEHANVGRNPVKGNVVRGGFGRSGFSVSS